MACPRSYSKVRAEIGTQTRSMCPQPQNLSRYHMVIPWQGQSLWGIIRDSLRGSNGPTLILKESHGIWPRGGFLLKERGMSPLETSEIGSRSQSFISFELKVSIGEAGEPRVIRFLFQFICSLMHQSLPSLGKPGAGCWSPQEENWVLAQEEYGVLWRSHLPPWRDGWDSRKFWAPRKDL